MEETCEVDYKAICSDNYTELPLFLTFHSFFFFLLQANKRKETQQTTIK